MNYKDIYFRISAGYKWGAGMEEEQRNAFFEEIQTLFENAGWRIDMPKFSGYCPEAHNWLSRLYCHPMEVGGVLAENLIEQVKDILKNGTTFKHYHTDEYETICQLPHG